MCLEVCWLSVAEPFHNLMKLDLLYRCEQSNVWVSNSLCKAHWIFYYSAWFIFGFSLHGLGWVYVPAKLTVVSLVCGAHTSWSESICIRIGCKCLMICTIESLLMHTISGWQWTRCVLPSHNESVYISQCSALYALYKPKHCQRCHWVVYWRATDTRVYLSIRSRIPIHYVGTSFRTESGFILNKISINQHKIVSWCWEKPKLIYCISLWLQY